MEKLATMSAFFMLKLGPAVLGVEIHFLIEIKVKKLHFSIKNQPSKLHFSKKEAVFDNVFA